MVEMRRCFLLLLFGVQGHFKNLSEKKKRCWFSLSDSIIPPSYTLTAPPITSGMSDHSLQSRSASTLRETLDITRYEVFSHTQNVWKIMNEADEEDEEDEDIDDYEPDCFGSDPPEYSNSSLANDVKYTHCVDMLHHLNLFALPFVSIALQRNHHQRRADGDCTQGRGQGRGQSRTGCGLQRTSHQEGPARRARAHAKLCKWANVIPYCTAYWHMLNVVSY